MECFWENHVEKVVVSLSIREVLAYCPGEYLSFPTDDNLSYQGRKVQNINLNGDYRYQQHMLETDITKLDALCYVDIVVQDAEWHGDVLEVSYFYLYQESEMK